MPCIKYQGFKFKPATRTIITQANSIIAEYSARGYNLTLRQLYYQFVSRDLIPNNQKSYKRLGGVINDARLAGEIDWDHITDRTRNLSKLSTWDRPSDIVSACAKQFRNDLWGDQPDRVEVWVEKDALVGVLEGVCNELRVPYFSCRGYTSQSEMWAAGERIANYRVCGQTAKILHLGDHDSSGIDMTRDIRDRLKLFSRAPVDVTRLALNMDQVERYQPPPNPAKETDSRFEEYNRLYGDESWELDALQPDVIADLIREAVLDRRDPDVWERSLAREEKSKDEIGKVARRWDSIVSKL